MVVESGIDDAVVDSQLTDFLHALSLDALAPIFDEEELTFTLLKTMASTEDDFASTLSELGIGRADAVKLQQALEEHKSAGQHRVTSSLAPAATPAAVAAQLPRADETSTLALSAFLATLSLEPLAPVFAEEDLTLKLLLWMATNEEDFAETVAELGIDA
eukprot:1708833-Prymnesium_polylepis.3